VTMTSGMTQIVAQLLVCLDGCVQARLGVSDHDTMSFLPRNDHIVEIGREQVPCRSAIDEF
jgi:hypothetical protein